jgi:cytochrome c oxidase assembly protein subunit 15
MLSWRPSARALRLTFLVALIVNTVIVVTGGAVRLTASGLGCPEVPKCTDESLVVTREMGAHGIIEFGNRLLTFAVTAAVVAALVAGWRAQRRDLARRALVLVLGTAAQALLGAVTVITGLHPVTVMAHFLLSMVLIAVAVDAYARAGGGPARTVTDVRRELVLLVRLLIASVAITLALGTVVTGTGPHSGDDDATNRLPFDLASVTQLHADFVFLTLGLTIGVLVAARLAAAHAVDRQARVLLGVALSQGFIGYAQYVTDLPAVLVGLHVLGACLVWIAALRTAVAARPAQSSSSSISNRASSDDRSSSSKLGTPLSVH